MSECLVEFATLGGETPRSVYYVGLQNRIAKKFAKFATELGSKSGVMRGFQKGGRTSGSA